MGIYITPSVEDIVNTYQGSIQPNSYRDREALDNWAPSQVIYENREINQTDSTIVPVNIPLNLLFIHMDPGNSATFDALSVDITTMTYGIIPNSTNSTMCSFDLFIDGEVVQHQSNYIDLARMRTDYYSSNDNSVAVISSSESLGTRLKIRNAHCSPLNFSMSAIGNYQLQPTRFHEYHLFRVFPFKWNRLSREKQSLRPNEIGQQYYDLPDRTGQRFIAFEPPNPENCEYYYEIDLFGLGIVPLKVRNVTSHHDDPMIGHTIPIVFTTWERGIKFSWLMELDRTKGSTSSDSSGYPTPEKFYTMSNKQHYIDPEDSEPDGGKYFFLFFYIIIIITVLAALVVFWHCVIKNLCFMKQQHRQQQHHHHHQQQQQQQQQQLYYQQYDSPQYAGNINQTNPYNKL